MRRIVNANVLACSRLCSCHTPSAEFVASGAPSYERNTDKILASCGVAGWVKGTGLAKAVEPARVQTSRMHGVRRAVEGRGCMANSSLVTRVGRLRLPRSDELRSNQATWRVLPGVVRPNPGVATPRIPRRVSQGSGR